MGRRTSDFAFRLGSSDAVSNSDLNNQGQLLGQSFEQHKKSERPSVLDGLIERSGCSLAIWCSPNCDVVLPETLRFYRDGHHVAWEALGARAFRCTCRALVHSPWSA